MKQNRIPVKGTFWQSAHYAYYMYIFITYIHVLFKKQYKTYWLDLMRILILINSLYGTKFRSKITNSKISKNFSYKKRNMSSTFNKTYLISETISSFFFNMQVNKLKFGFKRVSY